MDNQSLNECLLKADFKNFTDDLCSKTSKVKCWIDFDDISNLCPTICMVWNCINLRLQEGGYHIADISSIAPEPKESGL